MVACGAQYDNMINLPDEQILLPGWDANNHPLAFNGMVACGAQYDKLINLPDK
jgi:hypothetical protein